MGRHRSSVVRTPSPSASPTPSPTPVPSPEPEQSETVKALVIAGYAVVGTLLVGGPLLAMYCKGRRRKGKAPVGLLCAWWGCAIADAMACVLGFAVVG